MILNMDIFKKIKSRPSSPVSGHKRKGKKVNQHSQSLPPNLQKFEILNITEDAGRSSLFSCHSLATGSFSSQGISISSNIIDRSPSPHSHTTSDESLGSLSDDEDCVFEERKKLHTIHSHGLLDAAADKLKSPIKAVVSKIPSTMFLRTADLPSMKALVNQSMHSFSDLAESEWVDHVHKPSSRPPIPSMNHDPNESWVALDDGNGKRAPLAEAAMSALVKTGLDASMDKDMWTASGPTAKILKTGDWNKTLFVSFDQKRPVPSPHAKGAKGESDVLVWSGTFSHKYYGCDLPAIRCEAIVNMSPSSLSNLLIDSSRVKEYNKMSIGRNDIMVLHEDQKCVTKVVVGQTKPPMLGKILQLKSLLHMEELPGGSEQGGYVIISRAVAHADESEASEDPKVIHSEMLMGVNIIRAIEGEPDRCILITLNHLRSPMIPMMMAKRLGLSAAVNFINDIRALC